jgi:ferredoxin-NADP reductase
MAVTQKLRCEVVEITDVGEHVYTVELKPERPIPRFLPGQFLHLALDAYDPCSFWPESRVFSIASCPSERGRLNISYSVRGRFTARMERELAEGRTVWVKLPYGDFVVEDISDVVLLAGGTGITAFMAFLRGRTADFRHELYLAYGARDRDFLIYRDIIDAQAETLERVHLFYFVERATDGRPPPERERVGRLSLGSIWPALRDPNGATFYLSGPPQMLRDLSQELRTRGISPPRIRIDAWE